MTLRKRVSAFIEPTNTVQPNGRIQEVVPMLQAVVTAMAIADEEAIKDLMLKTAQEEVQVIDVAEMLQRKEMKVVEEAVIVVQVSVAVAVEATVITIIAKS